MHKTPLDTHGSEERLRREKSIALSRSALSIDRDMGSLAESSRGNFGGWGGGPTKAKEITNPLLGNLYRLERFGKAMEGNSAWEVPGAILNG